MVDQYVEGGEALTGDSVEPLVLHGDGTTENAMSCSPGKSAKTKFMLISWNGNGYSQAIPVGGEYQHTNSEITAIEIIDWNGASQLSIASNGGVVDFDQSSDSVEVDLGSQAVGTTLWWSNAENNDGSGPVVEVTHSCPSSIPLATDISPESYPVSWADLNTVVLNYTELDLLSFWSSVDEDDWPVFLLRVVEDSSGDSLFDGYLRIEVHGQGTMFSIPLNKEIEDFYTFNYQDNSLSAVGNVGIEDGQMIISLESVYFGTPLGVLTFDQAQVVLDGYTDINE